MMRETQGVGSNESFVKAHEDVIQISCGMFGHEGLISLAQCNPLRSKIRCDFMEIQRFEYNGKEVVNHTGVGGGQTRTIEHVLHVTLKTAPEMLQQPTTATSQYHGDPDDDNWGKLRQVLR